MNQPRMRHFLFVICMLCICQSYAKQNLICQANFQSYPEPSKWQFYQQVYYALVTNDQCWYSKYTQFFQVKKIDSLQGIWADLSTNETILLCQSLQFQSSKKYQLKYVIYTAKLLQTTITVQINNKNVSSQFYKGDYQLFSHTSYFSVQQSQNQICFSGTPQPTNDMVGAWLNNIQVTIADYYYISFDSQILQSQGSILLISNITYVDFLAQQIIKQYEIMAKNISIKYNIQENLSNSTLLVRLQPTTSFYIKDITFISIENPSRNQMMELSFQVNYSSRFFKYLNQNEKQTLSILLQLSDKLEWIMINLIKIIQQTFCSYFLFGLFRFWNIQLLYIFLLIQVVPQFTKEIYYQFLTSLFQQGNIFLWIKRNFAEPQQFYGISNRLTIGTQIQTYISNYKWFGAYGFSTDVLANNFLNFCVLAGLIVKIFIMKLINKYFVQKCLHIDVGKTFTGTHIFVAEVTTLSIQFMISALHCILGSSTSYLGQFHKISQIMILFLCIFSMGMYTILEYEKNSEQPKKVCKVQPTNKQNQREINFQQIVRRFVTQIKRIKFKYEDYFMQSSHTFLLLTMPLLLIFKSAKGFFIINSILIGMKTYTFKIKFKKMKRTDKIFQTTNTIVLLIHHVIFLAFYIIQNIQYDLGDKISNNLISLNLLGLGAIMTIVLGGFVEICYAGIKGLFFMIMVINKLQGFWKMSQNKKQEQNQKQVQERDRDYKENKKNSEQKLQNVQNKKLQINTQKNCVYEYQEIIPHEDNRKSIKQEIKSDYQIYKDFFNQENGTFYKQIVGITQNGMLEIRFTHKKDEQVIIKPEKIKPIKSKSKK